MIFVLKKVYNQSRIVFGEVKVLRFKAFMIDSDSLVENTFWRLLLAGRTDT